MKLRRRQFLHLAVGAAALSTVSGIARAQSYPTRPVRLIVASSPGGVHDVIARLWADQLKGTLGIIVIENRGGAGGTIGVNEVAHAQPDGYTLLLGSNSTHILQPLVGKRPGFDPIKDFDLVTIFAITSTAIAVHPSVPARTLRQLIEAAKAAPGKLSYAHGGVGSISNVAGEMFKQLAGGLDILPVPYRGMGPAQTDVIGGNVTMFVPNITGQVIGLHQGEKIRILAVNAASRHPSLPDIPTATEAGLPGMITQNFFGIFAPAGTPRAIMDRVNELTQAALADPEFQQRLNAGGFEPMSGFGPEQSRTFMHDEYLRWEQVIKSAGIKAE
jgi:tripartite-type tricarboxylate transporter receptor subunit TctC